MGVLMSAQWKKIRSVDLKGGDLPSGRMKPWREKIDADFSVYERSILVREG